MNPTRLKRFGGYAAAAVALSVLGLSAAVWLLSRPRPRGGSPDRAETMVNAVQTNLNREAWDQTGAIQWTFPRGHRHLWDRHRGLSRVQWGEVEVLQHLDRRAGIVRERGIEVYDERKTELLNKAWALFANDSFWLAAPFKMRDPGTSRAVATVDGTEGVWVEYGSGGVTPGDGYFWVLDESGRPKRWNMWVSIIPVGGVGVSWTGWTQVPTGAWIATSHQFDYVPFGVELEDVDAAATIEELVGEDPFAALF